MGFLGHEENGDKTCLAVLSKKMCDLKLYVTTTCHKGVEHGHGQTDFRFPQKASILSGLQSVERLCTDFAGLWTEAY